MDPVLGPELIELRSGNASDPEETKDPNLTVSFMRFRAVWWSKVYFQILLNRRRDRLFSHSPLAIRFVEYFISSYHSDMIETTK